MAGWLSWWSVGVPKRSWAQIPLQSKFSDFDYSPSPGVILTSEFPKILRISKFRMDPDQLPDQNLRMTEVGCSYDEILHFSHSFSGLHGLLIEIHAYGTPHHLVDQRNVIFLEPGARLVNISYINISY